MSLFRELGRRYEFYRQLAKRAARATATFQCEECGIWLGARRDRCVKCGYQPAHKVLEVAPGASDAVVKAAAREKIKNAHPDQGGSSRHFQRVKNARDQLLDG